MIDKNFDRCFVDSNVWLYAFSTNQKEERKRLLAKQLLQSHSIVISTQVINEVCCNLIKKHKLDEPSILKLILSFYNKYEILSLNIEILGSASNIRSRYHFYFWDSLIIASALSAGVDVLYSEDMQDGFVFEKKMTIVNPFKVNWTPALVQKPGFFA